MGTTPKCNPGILILKNLLKKRGLSHYSPPHEIIASHYGKIIMFGGGGVGAIGYLTTKPGGGL